MMHADALNHRNFSLKLEFHSRKHIDMVHILSEVTSFSFSTHDSKFGIMLKWIPWSKKRSILLQFGQWQMTNTEWPHSANTEKQRSNVLDHSAKAFEWNQMSPAASSNQVNVGKINLFIRDMHSVIVIEDYQIINTWL